MGESRQGVPAASFSPLGKYSLKEVTDLVSISIPIRGSYPEGSVLTGEFNICPEPGVILFGDLTKVMLVLGKYPKLTQNQNFVIAGLELDGDSIVIVGRVYELSGAVEYL